MGTGEASSERQHWRHQIHRRQVRKPKFHFELKIANTRSSAFVCFLLPTLFPAGICPSSTEMPVRNSKTRDCLVSLPIREHNITETWHVRYKRACVTKPHWTCDSGLILQPSCVNFFQKGLFTSQSTRLRTTTATFPICCLPAKPLLLHLPKWASVMTKFPHHSTVSFAIDCSPEERIVSFRCSMLADPAVTPNPQALARI